MYLLPGPIADPARMSSSVIMVDVTFRLFLISLTALYLKICLRFRGFMVVFPGENVLCHQIVVRFSLSPFTEMEYPLVLTSAF